MVVWYYRTIQNFYYSRFFKSWSAPNSKIVCGNCTNEFRVDYFKMLNTVKRRQRYFDAVILGCDTGQTLCCLILFLVTSLNWAGSFVFGYLPYLLLRIEGFCFHSLYFALTLKQIPHSCASKTSFNHKLHSLYSFMCYLSLVFDCRSAGRRPLFAKTHILEETISLAHVCGDDRFYRVKFFNQEGCSLSIEIWGLWFKTLTRAQIKLCRNIIIIRLGN